MRTLKVKSISVMLIFTMMMAVFMPVTASARTRPINTLDSGNGLNMSIDSNGSLDWDNVPGATGYTVTLTKPNFTHLNSWDTTNSAFALISSIDQLKYNSGQYTIVVSAKGVSASESMSYYYTSNVDQLEPPNGLYWDGDTANWSAVDGASIYHVELNNFDGRVVLQSTNSTSFDFSGFSPEDGWTFRVQARQSNSGTLSAKRDSLFIESPAKGTRTRPINALNSGNALNMNIGTDGILRWDEVSGATGYTISITQPNITNLYNWNSDNEAFALISSIDQLKYNSGQYTIVVSAKGVSASESMSYYYTSNVDQLESPNGLYWDGDTANWSAVDGASIYHVELNNFDGRVVLQSTNSTSFDFSGFSPEDGWTFRVQARQSNSGTLSAKRDSLFIESPAYEGGSITTYTCSFNSNGGTGTMADVTGLTGTYTLPANGFIAPANKQFKGWSLTSDGAIITAVEMTTDRTIYAIWEDIPATLINEVSATVTAPVGGEHPSFTVTVPDGAHYTAVVYAWYDLNNNGAHLTNSDTFVTGNEYHARIHFTANTGYEINSASYTINGTPNYSTFDTAKQRGMIFVATAPAVTTYTVTYDANGGTGSMADATGVSGEYTLLANGFTAPDGKQFKIWSVGGDEKTPGTSINVTEDTTVTAIWEDIPALTGTVTITGDAKYGSTLTATVENSNNTGELHYQWVRDTSNIITGANEQTYTILLENNINSTLKCIVTSSVQTGSIVSAPTAYVTKGDNLAVPTGLAGVAPTTLGGNDCYITGTTTAMEWSKYTDFHSTEGACSDGQTQVYHPGTYYVRYRQTSTYNAGTNYATVIVPDFGGAATYTVSFEANGGTGTMADVNGVAGTYTLPENGFTAPDGKQFKAWSVGGDEKAVGEAITVTANTTVTAVWENIPITTYTVTFDANGGSVTPANATTEATGKLTTLPTPTRSGSYTFKGWYTASSGGTQVTVDKVYTENTTIYAQWNYTGSTGGGGGVSKYTIKFETNGGTTVASKSVTRNAKLAEPTAPTKDGFKFDGWYTDKELKTAYDFDTKVTKSFTLYAKWTEVEKEPENEPDNTDKHNCPSEAFDDLDVNAWYHEDIDYALDNGIFKGVTEKEFAPNNNLTRAMMVTVLYRAEGEPAVNSGIPFADVDKGAYYANAVIWGQQNGIIKGYSETEFGPDDKITREQIAAIMHRYAQYKGYDVSVGENTNILSYDDFDSISEYAIPSMQWAVGSGLIKGKSESTLNPLDNATRAEIAAILHRFIEANK